LPLSHVLDPEQEQSPVDLHFPHEAQNYKTLP